MEKVRKGLGVHVQDGSVREVRDRALAREVIFTLLSHVRLDFNSPRFRRARTVRMPSIRARDHRKYGCS